MKRIFFYPILLLTSFFINGILFADHRDFLFEQGNQAYQNGKYEDAVKFYEEILEMKYENAELYYNLGNAFYKSGLISKAILNYHRALRLRPNDEDINFNLQIANLSVVDKIPIIPELFYIKYFNRLRSIFSLRFLTIIVLSLYFLFVGTWILLLQFKTSKIRLIFKTALFSFLILLLAFSFTFISKIMYERNVEAIIVIVQVDVRSSPSEDGTEIFQIHEGLKVKITDSSGDWYEIRLSDGKEGWLMVNDLEVI